MEGVTTARKGTPQSTQTREDKQFQKDHNSTDGTSATCILPVHV